MMAPAPIRRMGPGDVKRVVHIHTRAFAGFFLTFLGPAFLQVLYTAVCFDPAGIALVYEDGGAVVGFVAGTSDPEGFYKRLLRARWWRFALATIKPVLKRPVIIPRLLRAFKKPEEVASIENNAGELMSISVLPESQGAGIGKELVRAFLQEARNRKRKAVYLITDKRRNEVVNHFYQKLGFTCIRSYTRPEGREMNIYKIDL